ncbi:MAG TPA: hypothetical protein VHL59_04130 [Thermoanaerobaculia bacterium]|nr:hypothetical protein [Thermoanaerobaculia bacterium]
MPLEPLGPISPGVEQVLESVVEQAPVDVTWVMKDVRFENFDMPDFANLGIVGGMPLPPLVGVPITGPINPPGVPGVIGRLIGSVPLVLTRRVAEDPGEVDIQVEARWRIRDERGNLATDVEWRIGNGAVSSGGDVAVPAAQVFEALQLALPIVVVELTTAQLPVVRRSIQASVNLSAAGESSGWVDLPPIELLVPVIPMPTVLAMTVHVDLGGAVMIAVPADSPFPDFASLSAAVVAARDLIDPLQVPTPPEVFPPALDYLGAVVPRLEQLLNLAHVTYVRTNEIDNLNDYTLVQEGLFTNDIEAEDELSCLLFVGPPRRRVRLFNDRDFDPGEGQLDVTIQRELFVYISSLHGTSPQTLPQGRATVAHEAEDDEDGFGDTLSSLQFGWV